MTVGPLIVISGPSGSGKSTLIQRLLRDADVPLRLSVSATTRQRRPQEREGIDYFYWNREQFEAEIAASGFLEWADVFGNYYGTLRREVQPYREQGVGVVLDIDVQGWQQVRSRCPDVSSIFIRTTTLADLEQRLRRRRTEDEPTLQRRLRGAEAELAHADQYDYQVINDDVNAAAARLIAIVDGLARQPARGSCH